HRPGYGDPIRRRERARCLERKNEPYARDQERAVDLRDVDLPLRLLRGMNDADAGEVAELHRLLRQREGAYPVVAIATAATVQGRPATARSFEWEPDQSVPCPRTTPRRP